MQQQNRSNMDKQAAVLLSIQERLDNTNHLITAGNTVTSKIADALRLDWLRQLGSELKGFMRRIIAMNIATYHAVISIQTALPNHLERGLIEEPFILEDAIGRIAPVHLQFVTSWEAFNAVLQIRFRDLQGFKKVTEKQYGLQDKATGRDIEQTRLWERAFLPGQRVEMSFIFDSVGNEADCGKKSTCPGCQTTSANPTDIEIQCENCRMWFRRITVLQESEPPPQVPVPRPWKEKSEFGKSGFTGVLSGTVSGPVKPGKRRVRPSDLDGEDDLREFKRVRLITKRLRVRRRPFGRTGLGLKSFSTLLQEPSAWTSNPHSFPSKLDEPVEPTSISEDRAKVDDGVAIDPADIIRYELEKARREGLLSRLTSDISAVFPEEKANFRNSSTNNSDKKSDFQSRELADKDNQWDSPYDQQREESSPHAITGHGFSLKIVNPFNVDLNTILHIQKTNADDFKNGLWIID